MKGSMHMRWIKNSLPGFVVLMALGAAACTAQGQGISPSDYDVLRADNAALQQQLAAVAPTQVVQAGQLVPSPPDAQPTGWDTPESVRGRLQLLATYDSSGPDAWDVTAHPTVFFTSEGVGSNPNGGTRKSGVWIVDAYTKEVVASALFDLGEEVTQNPHSAGMSSDGQWLYVGQMHRVRATGQERTVLLVINARTLKLDKVLEGKARVDWFHHITAFKDWQGRDRTLVAFGRTPGGAPHYLLDPHDDNRVVQAVTMEDVGFKVGHPYPTMDPTFRTMYVSIIAPPWRGRLHNTAGIAKYNLETGVSTVIPWVGDNPIGMAHTADGRFTYVNDSEGSLVYKIDNRIDSVVGHTSAGVTGPYGLVLNWDESLLYSVGKGEGGHNRGSVLGVLATRPFGQARILHNMPIWLGGSASSVDHAILHPDPKVNELWVSNMRGWEMIVLDLDTHEVKAYIPTPNGGDTHSGGFVRYTPDWEGELLVDMGGPKGPMQAMMGQMAAAAAGAAATPVAGAAAPGSGQGIFETTAGGVGCASCHGMDGAGDASLSTPDIRTADVARIRSALAGVAQMSQIRLTEAEIGAVVRHLQQLNAQ